MLIHYITSFLISNIESELAKEGETCNNHGGRHCSKSQCVIQDAPSKCENGLICWVDHGPGGGILPCCGFCIKPFKGTFLRKNFRIFRIVNYIVSSIQFEIQLFIY